MRRLAVIALAACGSPTPPHAPEPRAREVAVHLEALVPGGEPLRSPVVDGSVNGVRVQLVLDTGASLSVIAGWLARAIKLDVRPAAGELVDSVGAAVKMQLARDVNVEIVGWGRVAEHEMIVAELPPFFEQAKVGVVLSPQHLAAAGDAVILDLRHGRLRVAPSIDAIPQLADGKLLTQPWVRACAVAGSLLPNVKFIVPVTLDGHAATLELDTGAETTRVRASSKVGEALAPRADSAATVAGINSATTTRVARAIPLVVGDVTATVDVKLLPGDDELVCPSDGLLGMDVLRRCTLVLTRLQAFVRCDA